MEPQHDNSTLASGSGANKAKDDLELGAQDYSKQIDPAGDDDGRDGVVQTDAVFGELVEGGPNYRAVGWLSTSVLMFKAQVGLGVLSLPFTLQTLGMVPGILVIAAIGVITTWGQYMIGEFKLKHRDVYSIDDVGYKLGGRVGREILGLASWLFMTFVAGAGMLSLSVALNAISTHGACTAIFVAVAAVAAAAIASIQTLGRIQGLGWVGVISILTAIIIMTIAVGVQDRPAEAPQEGPWERGVVYFGNPTFAQGCAAVSGVVLSYAGAPTFFPMIAEMRRPQDYNKSLILCTSVVVSAYLIVGCVVYHYAGQYVASPALGSAGVLMKKVCYGLAIPGLLVSTVLYSHFPAKYIFVRVLRGSDHLSRNTVKHWVVWLSSVIGCVVFSYVVASAIPVFNGLVSLIGASVGTLVCIQPMGAMWLYDNWSRPNRNLSWKLLAAWNISIIVIGFFLMGVGTYGSVKDIIDAYNASGGSAAWSCADNSNSVPSS